MKKWTTALLALIVLLGAALPAGAQVVVTGDFGKSATLLSYTQEENGAYSESLLVDDAVLITTGRDVFEAGRTDTIDNVLASAYSDAYDIAIMPAEAVAGHPAERVRFYQGGYEQTNVVDYVYIPADPWVFYVEISVPVEWREAYEELVEVWLGSVDLFDDGADMQDAAADSEEEFEPLSRPLEWSDVGAYIRLQEQEDAGTVQDLVEMFEPERFRWVHMGEGETWLELVCEGGQLNVLLNGETELGESLDYATDLPVSVLEMSYVFDSVVWTSAGFPLYPPRGLYVGDSMDGVIEAYAGGERIPLLASDSSLPADEAIVYTIPVEGAENEYAELTYTGCEGRIDTVTLQYIVDDGETVDENVAGG